MTSLGGSLEPLGLDTHSKAFMQSDSMTWSTKKGEERMNSREVSTNYRRTAIIVGVLFVIATAFLFIGQAVYSPYLETADYLELAYPNRGIAAAGILLEFACILAIPLIAVFAFPLLRRFNEPFALAYVGFRLFEAVLYVAVLIISLSLISVSQHYLTGSGLESPYFQELGAVLQSVSGWIFSIYLLIFGFGALIFYSVLYQSRLVPRWISVWGFLAAAFILVGGVLDLTGFVGQGAGPAFELIFAPPIAINEMVLAAWLIIKGFNPKTLVSDPDIALAVEVA
jgi:hypothetical protein